MCFFLLFYHTEGILVSNGPHRLFFAKHPPGRDAPACEPVAGFADPSEVGSQVAPVGIPNGDVLETISSGCQWLQYKVLQ